MFLQRLSPQDKRIKDTEMSETTYNVFAPERGLPVKAWTKGVPIEDAPCQQLLNVAQLPFVFKWVAAMPDVHWGMGATIGSVIPTKGRNHSGRGRRGYWMRNDGGPDQPECARSPRQLAWHSDGD
jgi:tRNA-splicing ligase RtcB